MNLIKKKEFDWRQNGYPSAVIYTKTVWYFWIIPIRSRLVKKKKAQ